MLNFSHLREGVTLGVVPLLPNVDDKVDQANLPQSCFFPFTSFSFFVFLCLKKQKQKLSEVVIPSTFSIVLCLRKLLQKIPAGGSEKTEAEKKERQESFI